MSAYAELLEKTMEAILRRDPAPALSLCRDKQDFPPAAQLSVYVEGYRLRLYDVVEATYPALRYHLGAAAFRTLAEGFIEATPSRAFNLDKYPIPFACYVAGAGVEDFARELALLESAVHSVYQGEESPAVLPGWAAGQTPETLATARLVPRTASRLLALRYPVNAYLTAFRDGKIPQKPLAHANWLMVLRHRHQVKRLELAQAEHALLSLLAQGKMLAQALEDERFAEFAQEPDITERLMHWFARWVNEGMLRQPL